MSNPNFPQCYKRESKPSNFCSGCGQSLMLKNLGFIIDELEIAQNTVIVTDIGCSLLSWDFFDIDTVQSHHGRAACLSMGLKKALPKSVILSYMGDGGGYAIGLSHLINVAKRNDPITVILVNNTVFAMTGGQKAPTTILGETTESTPDGKFTEEPIFGPELLKNVISKDAFLARTSVDNLPQLKKYLTMAIENQIKNNSFSFVEVLTLCPTNWKTNAKESLDFLDKLKQVYKMGVISDE